MSFEELEKHELWTDICEMNAFNRVHSQRRNPSDEVEDLVDEARLQAKEGGE